MADKKSPDLGLKEDQRNESFPARTFDDKYECEVNDCVEEKETIARAPKAKISVDINALKSRITIDAKKEPEKYNEELAKLLINRLLNLYTKKLLTLEEVYLEIKKVLLPIKDEREITGNELLLADQILLLLDSDTIKDPIFQDFIYVRLFELRLRSNNINLNYAETGKLEDKSNTEKLILYKKYLKIIDTLQEQWEAVDNCRITARDMADAYTIYNSYVQRLTIFTEYFNTNKNNLDEITQELELPEYQLPKELFRRSLERAQNMYSNMLRYIEGAETANYPFVLSFLNDYMFTMESLEDVFQVPKDEKFLRNPDNQEKIKKIVSKYFSNFTINNVVREKNAVDTSYTRGAETEITVASNADFTIWLSSDANKNIIFSLFSVLNKLNEYGYSELSTQISKELPKHIKSYRKYLDKHERVEKFRITLNEIASNEADKHLSQILSDLESIFEQKVYDFMNPPLGLDSICTRIWEIINSLEGRKDLKDEIKAIKKILEKNGYGKKWYRKQNSRIPEIKENIKGFLDKNF